MQNSQGLFRVLRVSPYVRLNVKGHLKNNKNILQHLRLFNHESIRNPKQWGKVISRTAIFTGTLLVGGLVVKLNSRRLDNDTKAEGQDGKEVDELYWRQTNSLTLSEAIRKSRDLLQMKKDLTGSPGLTVAVSVDGRTVWAEGIGYSDIENRVKCTPYSVFRIASISKSITMATVAKLIENGDLDIDKPVQYYVPEFPEKTWEGQKVEITTRQLLSHQGGIRHYRKDYMTKSKEPNNDKGSNKKGSQKSGGETKVLTEDQKKAEKDETKSEMSLEEYYITKHYKSVEESLALFKDDPLVHKPGSKFLYTTHGWTLISAVAEKAAKMPFDKFMKQALDELGLENTYLEEHQPVIKNRGRHYVKNKKGNIENAPYVDLSYKWAGGGLISNVLDVAQFGNAMLFSYQARPISIASSQSTSSEQDQIQDPTKTGDKESDELDEGNVNVSGYLKPETMKMMWTPTVIPESNWQGVANNGYGLGWSVCTIEDEYAFGKDQRFFVSHTGGAIGASSVLFILPTRNSKLSNKKSTVLQYEIDGSIKSANTFKDLQKAPALNSSPPKGVVVAIIVNMTSVGLNKTAYDIAKLFEQVDLKI